MTPLINIAHPSPGKAPSNRGPSPSGGPAHADEAAGVSPRAGIRVRLGSGKGSVPDAINGSCPAFRLVFCKASPPVGHLGTQPPLC